MTAHVIAATSILIIAGCEGPPVFNPPADSYSESQVTIDGGADRTIGSIDSTFFGASLPLLGRLFIPQEYAEGAQVAIISHEFWMEQFEGQPHIIGSKIRVGDVERTIVGVMPQGVNVPENVALWIPRMLQLRTTPG